MVELIPRKFEFKLTEDEKTMLLECFEEETNRHMHLEANMPNDVALRKIKNEMVKWPYYLIGMNDYDMYNLPNSDPNLKGKFLSLFTIRAHISAMLQSFIEKMTEMGYNPKIEEFQATEEKSEMLPSTIYHGTPADITAEELGKIGKDGKYKIRDGVTYFTDEERARRHFSRGGKILARDISPDDRWARLNDTQGDTCFIYQNELMELCNKGVKYLYSIRKGAIDPQILDIEHFSDFVQKRDEAINSLLERFNIRLPKKEEGLLEYLNSIGIDKNAYEEIASGWQEEMKQNVWSTGKKDKQAKYITFDELFSSKEKITQIGKKATEDCMSDSKTKIDNVKEATQIINEKVKGEKINEEQR